MVVYPSLPWSPYTTLGIPRTIPQSWLYWCPVRAGCVVETRIGPGLKPGNNKEGEALGSLLALSCVTVNMVGCAELFRSSRREWMKDWIDGGSLACNTLWLQYVAQSGVRSSSIRSLLLMSNEARLIGRLC